MQIPFPFEPMLVFGALAIFLLIGIALRAFVPLFQKFLIPSCLIGGLIGLIALAVDLIPFEASSFETMAYHFFNISFISVGLTAGIQKKKGRDTGRDYLKGAWWMALMEGVTISIQAIIGCFFVMAFGFFGQELFPTFGLFLPLGFTEGPGQALSIGKVWEGFGFQNAATIGLTFSAVGFLLAFLAGVPLVNWGIRKGYSVQGRMALPRDLLIGIYGQQARSESAGNLTMHSGNVDTLAFQMALIGLVYVLTYLVTIGLGQLVGPNAGRTLWGFFFFFGMFIALGLRWLMGRFGLARLIDPGIQRRITGWAVDFLIVATVTGVQLVVVWQYILPITVMSFTAGAATLWILFFFGRRLPDLNLERLAAIYGTCTGTVSSGLLLLRIVDPEFKTNVPLELGLMNVLVSPIILLSMILVNAPVWWNWSVLVTLLVHAGLLIAAVALVKISRLIGRPRF